MEAYESLIDVPRNGLEPPSYRGSVRNGLLGLLYLVKKFPECRVVLSFALQEARRDPDGAFGWSSFAFFWRASDASLQVPGKDAARYERVLEHCVLADRAARWLATPLTLRSVDGHMHANFLLVHLPTRRVFRFEPYGITPSMYDGHGLDSALGALFRLMLPGARILAPESRRLDMQHRQESETMRSRRRERGYCQAFSVLYACVQMAETACSAADASACHVEAAMARINNHFERHDGRITAWMRAFAKYLREQYARMRLDTLIVAYPSRGTPSSAPGTSASRQQVLVHVCDDCPPGTIVKRIC